MANLNTPEYLEKCKQRIIENLRHCQFAPSVQMQDVPRDMFVSDGDDSEDDAAAWDEDGDFPRGGFNIYRESIRARERNHPFGDELWTGEAPSNGSAIRSTIGATNGTTSPVNV